MAGKQYDQPGADLERAALYLVICKFKFKISQGNRAHPAGVVFTADLLVATLPSQREVSSAPPVATIAASLVSSRGVGVAGGVGCGEGRFIEVSADTLLLGVMGGAPPFCSDSTSFATRSAVAIASCSSACIT